ncbi:MAG: hypothetical protein D6717_07275 [Gammaproteobacteria bacterium]|nr:MAG: hypothetical protein D6717_07275 [Gammaproteobacteria bacterium]
MRRLSVLVLCLVLFGCAGHGPRSSSGSVPTSELSDITVAVLPFAGNDAVAAEGAAANVAAELAARSGWTLVERAELERLLKEIRLSLSDLVDPAHAVEAGRFLGARYMVFGSLQQLEERVRLTCRMVEVATGRIVAAASLYGRREGQFDMEREAARRLLAGVRP